MKIARNLVLLTLLLATALFAARPVAADHETYTFATAGDVGSGTNFTALVDAMNVTNPLFFMLLGDLSYAANEASWCSTWQTGSGNPSGKFYKNARFVTGNHESGESSGGNINIYTETANCGFGGLGTFTSSQNRASSNNQEQGCTWPDSTRKCYAKEYYFDLPATSPRARIIHATPQVTWSPSIDTANRWTYDNCSGSNTHCRWVRDAIDSAKAAGLWVIVTMHKNHIEMSPAHGAAIGQEFFNMLVERKVDLILQGHVHNYERTKQLAISANCPSVTTTFDADCVVATGNKFYRGDGSILLINGAGGQTLHSLDSNESDAPYFQSTNADTFGYSRITISKARLDATFVKTAGSGTFTESFSILDNKNAGFEVDWSDFNNDGLVSILDAAQISNYFDQVCTSWIATPQPCYWDRNGPHDGTGKVDITDVATVAVYFDTLQPSPYLGEGSPSYKLDEYWRTRCSTLNTVNSGYCTFYFANN